MSSFKGIGVVVLCALAIGSAGCRAKQPAATPDTKATEGPLLAPPQQQTPPATPPGDHAALPTEGEPAGKSATAAAAATPPETAQAAQPTEGEPNGKAHDATAAAETAEVAEIKKNLAVLSTADRALAQKQKICPVSGEPLGAMGPPKKISVAGRDVFICCPSCEEPLTNEPAKYLAKVGLQPASGQ